MARRAGYTERYAKQQGGEIIQVDLGNYFMPLGPGADIVNDFMMQSLDQVPVHVMNLGTEDLFLWPAIVKKQPGTKIISTNLVPKTPSVPRPPGYAVIEVPAAKIGVRRNVRVGFVGFSNPALVKPNSGFSALDVIQAYDKVKPELVKKADFVVVLGDIPKPIAVKLAQANPEIYAIMLIERHFMIHTPEQVNNAVLLYSVERGRYLGQLVMELDQGGRVSTFKPVDIALDAKAPEDQAFLKRQNEIEAKVPASARH